MGRELKPIGRAVATVRGHYPQADGRDRTIAVGETFTVYEGLDKAKWFTVLAPDTPAPVIAKPPASPPGPDTLSAAAGLERRRKAAVKPPTSDDIA